MKHSAIRLALLTGVAVAALVPCVANAWTLTARGEGAERYCTISQKTNQGAVATYALNAQGQTSFALDFQKNRLDPAQSIALTFASGSWTRTVKTTPASPRAVIIALGDDPVFDKELRQGETLTIRLDNETQDVPLAEFANQRRALDRCLLEQTADAPRPPAGADTPKPPPSTNPAQVSAPDALSLAEENRTLRQALETQRRALEEARQKAPGSPALQDLTAKIQSLEARNRALEDAARSADATAARAPSSDLVRLETENAALKADIAALRAAPPTPAPPADQIQKLTDQLRSLRAQNDQLAQQLLRTEQERDSAFASAAAQPPPTVERADNDPELMTLRADNARLVRELAELRTDQAAQLANPTDNSEITALRDQVARLQADKITLEQALSASQASDPNVGDLASTRAPVRRQLRELMAENGALQAQLKNLSEEMEVLRLRAESKELSLAGDNWSAELATRRYQEAEREIERLGRTLREQQERCAAEKKEIEYMLFDPKISNSAQNALVNSLQDKIAAMELELKTLRNQATSFNETPAAPVIRGVDPQSVADMKDAHQRELDTLQRKIALLETQQREAEQRVNDTPDRTQEMLAAQRQLDNLNAELTRTRDETDRLRDQNQSLLQRVSSLTETIASAPVPAPPAARAIERVPPPPSARPVLPPPSSAAKNIQSDLQTPMGAIVGMPRPPLSVPAPSGPAPLAAASQGVSDDIKRLLQESGVSADTQVIARTTGTKTIYEWTEGPAHVFLHHERLGGNPSMDAIAESYLSAMEQKCDGDFAVLPSTDGGDDPTRQAYETACAARGDPGSVQSAALLFSLQGNQLRTLTVGSAADAMDEAMRLRDRFNGRL